MAEKQSRREFLKTVSLAGAALVATDGAAVAETGKRQKQADEKNRTLKKKVWAWIDENGCLNIDDEDLEGALYAVYQQYGSICVSFDVPGSEGNRVNSLCNC